MRCRSRRRSDRAAPAGLLGVWILRTACLQLVEWARDPQTAHWTLAVNVSARQFRHSHFVDEVLGVLEETGANPHRL